VTPAPLSRRFVAGVVDALVVTVLAALSFFGPMMANGFVFPMWGVLLVLLGYSVVPLALFQQTLGLKLMGLAVCNSNGYAVDPANLAFRELLGRGFFPLAYLYNIGFGVLASVLGLMQVAMPSGLGLVTSIACLVALVAALLGVAITAGRADGRLAADLMCGSFVVVAPARPAPDDPDEKADAGRLNRRRWVWLVALEVAFVAALVAVPAALTARSSSPRAVYAARMKRKSLEQRFAADPGNRQVAAELRRAWLDEGKPDEAQAVVDRHRQTLEAGLKAREEALRRTFVEKPDDEATFDALETLLTDSDRLSEADALYADRAQRTGRATDRLEQAQWLLERGDETGAEAAVTLVLAKEPALARAYVVQGLLEEARERLPQAQEAFFLATLLDSEDEEASDGLERVGAPVPGVQKRLLARAATLR
jgi:uncharacterized RDD family membrane protein YckC